LEKLEQRDLKQTMPFSTIFTWPWCCKVHHSLLVFSSAAVSFCGVHPCIWYSALFILPYFAVYSGICTAQLQIDGRHVNIPARPRLSTIMWVPFFIHLGVGINLKFTACLQLAVVFILSFGSLLHLLFLILCLLLQHMC